ncbi:putative 3prime, partial [Diplonema papillatum]
MQELSNATNDAYQKLEWYIATVTEQLKSASVEKCDAEVHPMLNDMSGLMRHMAGGLRDFMHCVKRDFSRLLDGGIALHQETTACLLPGASEPGTSAAAGGGDHGPAKAGWKKCPASSNQKPEATAGSAGNRELEKQVRLLRGAVQQKSAEIQALRLRGAARQSAQARPYTNESAVSCALTLLLESLAFAVNADRATLFTYIPSAKLLQGIAAVNTPEVEARWLCVPADKGFAGSVFTSGIALNLNSTYPDSRMYKQPDLKYRIHNMLCFPIRGFGSSEPVGVVQFLNKSRGGETFSPADEAAVKAALPQLGYLASRYPVDLTKVSFRLDELHRLRDFCDRQVVDKVEGLDIPSQIESFSPKQLVFRTSTSGQFLKYSKLTNATAVGPSPSLIEIDLCMKRLEDCWKKTADEWVNMESSHVSVKNAINRSNRKLKASEDRLDRARQEKEEYREAYAFLKQELRSVVHSPKPPPRNPRPQA